MSYLRRIGSNNLWLLAGFLGCLVASLARGYINQIIYKLAKREKDAQRAN